MCIKNSQKKGGEKMEDKKVMKISLSTFLLIFALIIILIMAYFMFKLYNEKQEQNKNIDTLKSQISSLTSENQNLQGKIDTISNTINSNPTIDSNNDINILKPSKKISKLLKKDEAEYYVANDSNADEFYINEISIGDAVWSGLVADYKASSTHSKDTADYNAQNLDNLFIDNCWCEGSNNNGIGETIEVNAFGSCEKVTWTNTESKQRKATSIDDLKDYLLTDFNKDGGRPDNATKITEQNISSYHNTIGKIAIINGNAKTDELWKNNSRVKKLKLTIDNKIEYILELEDSKNLQLFELKYENDSILKKINLKFEILEVYPGDKYEDTCLTSLYLVGGADIPWGGR